MKKNLHPKTLSRFLAIIISCFCAIIFILISIFSVENQWFTIVIAVLFIFIVSYIVIYHSLHSFITSRIRPIYKMINSLATPEEELLEAFEDKDVILELHKDVKTWIQKTTNQIQMLKESDRYRKEFLGNVAHELKTPIFNIQGYILTLIDDGWKDEKINKKYLKRTEKNINRLIATIKDVDTISRLETGELKLNFEEFNICQLVTEVFEMQDIRAEGYDITLDYTSIPEHPIMVAADKKRIFEILNNLIVNSIKYGKPNGRTRVKIEEIDDKVHISISDDGIGIAERHLPHIFKRFYRVDKSRSRERGGSGLGLAIVKHIIEAHKQSITLKSKLNEGTTFTFTLKRCRPNS